MPTYQSIDEIPLPAANPNPPGSIGVAPEVQPAAPEKPPKETTKDAQAPASPPPDEKPEKTEETPPDATIEGEEARPAPEKKAPAELTDETEIEVEGEKVKLANLKRAYQKSSGADRKLREAAQVRQDAEWVLQSIGDPQADPFEVLAQIYAQKFRSRSKGREMVYNKVQEYVNTSGMANMMLERDENLRQQMRLKLELEDRDHELQQIRDREDKAKLQREVEEFTNRYVASVGAAIKAAGLPQSPKVEALVARKLRETAELEGNDLTVEQAVSMVKQDIEEEFQKRAEVGLDYDFIASKNPALLEALRKKDIERLKAGAKTTSAARTSPGNSNGSTPAKGRYLTPDEFFKR